MEGWADVINEVELADPSDDEGWAHAVDEAAAPSNNEDPGWNFALEEFNYAAPDGEGWCFAIEACGDNDDDEGHGHDDGDRHFVAQGISIQGNGGMVRPVPSARELARRLPHALRDGLENDDVLCLGRCLLELGELPLDESIGKKRLFDETTASIVQRFGTTNIFGRPPRWRLTSACTRTK